MCVTWPLLVHLGVFAVFRQLIGPRPWPKSILLHRETEVWLAVCLPYCKWGKACTPHIQTKRVWSLTSTMSHVAKMHLGNCLALKGFAGRRRGMGMGGTDTSVVSALDLCVCIRAIYEETLAPFLQTELLVCHRSCCANISCRWCTCCHCGIYPPSPCFPPCIAIHFICQMHKGRQTHNRGTF